MNCACLDFNLSTKTWNAIEEEIGRLDRFLVKKCNSIFSPTLAALVVKVVRAAPLVILLTFGGVYVRLIYFTGKALLKVLDPDLYTRIFPAEREIVLFDGYAIYSAIAFAQNLALFADFGEEFFLIKSAINAAFCAISIFQSCTLEAKLNKLSEVDQIERGGRAPPSDEFLISKLN